MNKNSSSEGSHSGENMIDKKAGICHGGEDYGVKTPSSNSMTIMVMHLDVVAPTIDGLTILEVLKRKHCDDVIPYKRSRDRPNVGSSQDFVDITMDVGTDDIASTTVNPLEVSHKTPMEDASKLGHETLATTINPVEVSHKTPIATASPIEILEWALEVPKALFRSFHGVPPMGVIQSYNQILELLPYKPGNQFFVVCVVAIHEGSTKYLVKAIKEHEDFTTKSALSLEPKEAMFRVIRTMIININLIPTHDLS
ncbi:hypothetical protein FNV43_RR02393 [Rhamnella rubrinervis]|uniref:Uncharacterized protein n=1 Tax=Rhamnella rubrinervis TaxID=2594499 RepID=A0A8K0HS59_9ROSA|nr:hypothetical protein FNV43_RR02393 [Rhamnella rubrinervis]